MVAVLVEVSVPRGSLETVARFLDPERLAEGLSGRLQVLDRPGGCAGPARGGDVDWVPCWLSLEAGAEARDALRSSLPELRALLVDACAAGGVGLRCLPAAARIDERWLRLRDLADLLRELD